MHTREQILLSIKTLIKEVLPDASISLFGSRATNTHHEESDWDILVLSKEQITKELKKKIHDKIFPLGVSIGSFINVLIVAKREWEQSPAWYSLKKNIGGNSVPL